MIESKLNILIVISSYATALRGEGGHYVSAIHYFQHLKQRFNVQILVVGSRRSPAIDRAVPEAKFINLKLEGIWAATGRLQALLQKLGSPPLVLAFDEPAYLFSRLATVFKRQLRFVKIKAGGGRPHWLYTATESLIVFSSEEESWLRRTQGQSVYVFSNRVCKKFLMTRQKTLPWTNFGVKRILMVCRINKSKETYFRSLHNLLVAARNERIRFEVMVVGSVSEKAFFKELESGFEDLNTVFLTDPDYTSAAYCYLADCDIAVVMGRSVPEAVILGRQVLVPVGESTLPIRLSSETFGALQYANFSNRAVVNFAGLTANDLLGDQPPSEENRVQSLVERSYSLDAGYEILDSIVRLAKRRRFVFDFLALRGLPLLLRMLQLESLRIIPGDFSIRRTHLDPNE